MKKLTPEGYMEYLSILSQKIAGQKDYITSLDAAIADGDHWLNLTIGYSKLLDKQQQLSACKNFGVFFMQLAIFTMSSMGGTSGALYGGMYLAAAKAFSNVEAMDAEQLSKMLEVWDGAIQEKGNTVPGQKTMVDALHPAATAFREALDAGVSDDEALREMVKAAKKGAEETENMQAMRGRASNQPRKGVGHLDPGAVTMAIQMEMLADYLIAG